MKFNFSKSISVLGMGGGLIIVFAGVKYIGSYLPDIDVVGFWLYIFHLMLGALVMLKGVDWIFDHIDELKTKKVK